MRVVIYPNDHRPAHVHAMSGSGEAIFILNCPDGPSELRASFGFGQIETARIKTIIEDELAALCAAWSDIHG